MDFQTIAAIILGSSVVSSVITILLQAFLTSRIEHSNTREIERLKAKLAVQSEAEEEFQSRKFGAFSEVASLVYRCRNMAKDLVNTISDPPKSLAHEFGVRTKELEEALYQNRLILEKERAFQLIHTYKNLLQAFGTTLSNNPLGGTEAASVRSASELVEIYKSIDLTYQHIVEALAQRVSPNAPTN